MPRRSRKGSIIQADKSIDYTSGRANAISYDVVYKGDRVASESSGDHAVREVITQFEDYESLGKKVDKKEALRISEAEGCALVISPGKIEVIHKKQQQKIVEELPRNLTFATTLSTGGKDFETFAYISHNIRLSMYRCHVFLVWKGDGKKLVDLTKKTKMEFEEMAQKAMANPFASVPNAPREVPKGQLFNKQIHRGDIKAVEIIGSGQFGAVYLANQKMRVCPISGKLFAIDGHLKRHMEKLEQQGKTAPPNVAIEKKDVVRAVKMLKGSATPDAKKEFLREAEIMLNFEHENVTVIQGVAVQQPPWLYVLEYCMYGDLRQVLIGCRNQKFKVSPKEFLHMTIGILRGMEHIASLGFVHLDLAARNCLLAENNIVKVADFGLTRKFENGQKTIVLAQKGLKLALKWLPPEALRKREFSEQSDVWAFGVTIWELYTYGAMPYHGLNNDGAQKVVLKGEILAQPEACSDEVWALLVKSMSFNRENRGDFKWYLRPFTKLYQEESTTVRDVGKSLHDPELMKERVKQRMEAKKLMQNHIFQASQEEKIWFKRTMDKAEAERLVLQSVPGSFVVREDSPERLVLVVNEAGVASQIPIILEDNRFRFYRKLYSSVAEIIGCFRYDSFPGQTGGRIKLGKAAVPSVNPAEPARSRSRTSTGKSSKSKKKKGSDATQSVSPDPTAFTGSSRGNPLFQEQDDDGADKAGTFIPAFSEEDL